MSTSVSRRQSGVTLVELILFIVIVGVAVGGVLSVLTLSTRHSADPLRRKQALALAEALLEEVELAQFTYCEPNAPGAESAGSVAACGAYAEAMGAETGETRPYDNVNDYWALNGMPFNDKTTGELLDAAGRPFNLPGYAVSLSVTPENFYAIPQGGTSGDVLHLAITVTYDAGRQVRLDGYRMRYAPTVQ
ncbi:MAG: prepilin-type N-terminal cleavage/methylation domain-containing protein [Telluria sp.]